MRVRRLEDKHIHHEPFLYIPLDMNDDENHSLSSWTKHAVYGPRYFEPCDMNDVSWYGGEDSTLAVIDDEDVRVIMYRCSITHWNILDENQEQLYQTLAHADVSEASMRWWRPATVDEILAAMRAVHYNPADFAPGRARRIHPWDVSPTRAEMRSNARESLERNARVMVRNATQKGPAIHVGTVVHVATHAADRNRLSRPNLTLVCVELVAVGQPFGNPPKKEVKYRLAGKHGVMPTLYARSHVKALPQTTALAMGLDAALEDWRSMPTCSMRKNMGAATPMGVQGHVHCNCTKTCEAFKCSCRKAGVLCNSRCHKGNKNCRNHAGAVQFPEPRRRARGRQIASDSDESE